MKRGEKLDPIDQLWLAGYDEEVGKNDARKSKNQGHSRSGRKINFQLEEAAEATGEGNAAVAAATAALVAKAEGERLDALTIGAIDALKASAEINRQTALMLREDYGAMFESMARRAEILESTHIAMLESVRAEFLARTNAEGALMQQQQEGDPANQMLLMVIAKHLGIDLSGVPPQLPPTRPRPRPNGVPPKPNTTP